MAEPGYASDLIANHALEFIAAQRERPFCLHVADFADYTAAQQRAGMLEGMKPLRDGRLIDPQRAHRPGRIPLLPDQGHERP